MGPSPRTAGLSVPVMLPGGSRERIHQGPVGQHKLVWIPGFLGPGRNHWGLGMLQTISQPLRPSKLPREGDTVGEFSNKVFGLGRVVGWAQDMLSQPGSRSHLLPRILGRDFLPEPPGHGKVQTALVATTTLASGTPGGIPVAVPSATPVPGAAGHPAGLTCSQVNRDAPGWGLAEPCRDWGWAEGAGGDGEGTGKIKVPLKARQGKGVLGVRKYGKSWKEKWKHQCWSYRRDWVGAMALKTPKVALMKIQGSDEGEAEGQMRLGMSNPGLLLDKVMEQPGRTFSPSKSSALNTLLGTGSAWPCLGLQERKWAQQGLGSGACPCAEQTLSSLLVLICVEICPWC